LIDLKKFKKSIITGLFFGFIFFFAYNLILNPIIFVGTSYPFISIIPFNPNQLIATNQNISDRYVDEILPRSKNIVSSELDVIRKKEDINSKLDEIFRWETNDWHNPQWETIDFDFFNNSQNYISYKHDPNKLRAILQFENSFYRQQNPQGVFYSDDPYWLAYNKVGSCRELANLFSFMAQQSGIESRTVSSYLGDHRWAEVKINGEWMYYDPWCAYQRYKWNLSFKDKWFNKIENYRDNCHGFTVLNTYDGFIPNPEPSITYPFWYGIHDLKTLINISLSLPTN
jgi:hypothetical protein